VPQGNSNYSGPFCGNVSSGNALVVAARCVAARGAGQQRWWLPLLSTQNGFSRTQSGYELA
jgi:hypothetical protein